MIRSLFKANRAARMWLAAAGVGIYFVAMIRGPEILYPREDGQTFHLPAGDEKEKEKWLEDAAAENDSEPIESHPFLRSTRLAGGATHGEDSERHPRSEESGSGSVRLGLISQKPFEFFQRLRDEIDNDNPVARCERYGFRYNGSSSFVPRRVYYGALIANEPWELFEVLGAEAFGLLSGVVFVEGNRTQNFTPRNASRLQHGPAMAKIFGVPRDRVLMKLHVNEDPDRYQNDWDQYLSREQAQRQDILVGWKELGMQPDDLGYLADSDEAFSRDFLLALKTCDGIPDFDYARGRCRHTVNGLKAFTLVFEGSPECPTKDHGLWRPEVFLGHCIEEIGDERRHPKAPRPAPDSMDRAIGFGDRGTMSWEGEDNVTDGRYPLYHAADLRRIGGSSQYRRRQEGHSEYSGYHFHNFFAGADSIRFKYRTYAHDRETDYRYRLRDLSSEMDMMARCAVGDTSGPPSEGGNGEFLAYVPGGLLALEPPYPIYFHDEEYRRARHDFVASLVREDDEEWSRHNPTVGGPGQMQDQAR